MMKVRVTTILIVLMVNTILPLSRLLQRPIRGQRLIISRRQLVVFAGKLDANADLLKATTTTVSNIRMPWSTFQHQQIGRVVHQVEVAHLIGGRRANDRNSVFASRVESASGK